MINALIVHGGVVFAFADSALAFSSDNSGEASVNLQSSINFIKAEPVKLNNNIHDL